MRQPEPRRADESFEEWYHRQLAERAVLLREAIAEDAAFLAANPPTRRRHFGASYSYLNCNSFHSANIGSFGNHG